MQTFLSSGCVRCLRDNMQLVDTREHNSSMDFTLLHRVEYVRVYSTWFIKRGQKSVSICLYLVPYEEQNISHVQMNGFEPQKTSFPCMASSTWFSSTVFIYRQTAHVEYQWSHVKLLSNTWGQMLYWCLNTKTMNMQFLTHELVLINEVNMQWECVQLTHTSEHANTWF